MNININGASLADILKLNGTISGDEKSIGYGMSEREDVSTSGVTFSKDGENIAGITKGMYSRKGADLTEAADRTSRTDWTSRTDRTDRTNRTDWTEQASRTSGRTDSGRETTPGVEQVKACVRDYVNRVSADSYEEFEKMGIIPDQEEPETFLTVSERIEIELAAHCKDYVPYGSIDIDDIRKVYGNTGRTYEIAAALQEQGLNITADTVAQVEEGLGMAEELGEITPEMSAYLLKNDLTVSIENLYKAQYSVTDGRNPYNSSTISGEDWEQLSGQITAKLEAVGISVDAGMMEDARWMLENQIPVTAKNLLKMQDIHSMNQINGGTGLAGISEEQWIKGLTGGLAFEMGIPRMSVDNMVSSSEADGESAIIRQAEEAVHIFENGNDEQVEHIISQGKEVTLLTMKKVQEETVYAGNRQRQEWQQEREWELEQERQWQQKAETEKGYLEEIKMTMSISGFAILLKNGFELQIASLQEISMNLKVQENQYADAVFESVGKNIDLPEKQQNPANIEEKRELFWSGIHYMGEFKKIPAYVLGDVASGEISFEVEEMCIEGAVKESVLKSAMTAYDTMSTRVRPDLGDSVRKAFAGIDDILKDLELENTPLHQRAARILSYNEMDITRENIQIIKEMDLEVSRLIDNMTPKTTAYLIANGINPLKTDIRKLNDKLDELNEKIEADTGEKFSQFLWKLDKKGDITPEERKSYIGIYRALNMIQKSDRKVLGEIVKAGEVLTLRSLMRVARSMDRHMDTAIDDGTGLTEQLILPDNNPDVQLESLAEYDDTPLFRDSEERYMNTLVNKSMDLISPQSLAELMKETENGDMSLEQFVNQLMQYSDAGQHREEELRKAYYEEVIKEDATARFVSEEVINSLIGTGAPLTISNLLAASGLMSGDGKGLWRFLGVEENKDGEKDAEVERYAETEKYAEAERELLDSMEKEASFEKAYYEMLERMAENIREEAFGDKIDIAHVRGMNREISYLRQSVSQKSYYVPVQIGNRKTTIHLTIRTGEQEKGKVEIEMNTEDYGNVKGELLVQGTKTEINIQTDSSELEQKLEENKQALEQEINSVELQIPDTGEQSGETGMVTTDRLYQLAKKLIYYVKVSAND